MSNQNEVVSTGPATPILRPDQKKTDENKEKQNTIDLHGPYKENKKNLDELRAKLAKLLGEGKKLVFSDKEKEEIADVKAAIKALEEENRDIETLWQIFKGQMDNQQLLDYIERCEDKNKEEVRNHLKKKEKLQNALKAIDQKLLDVTNDTAETQVVILSNSRDAVVNQLAHLEEEVFGPPSKEQTERWNRQSAAKRIHEKYQTPYGSA